MERPGWHPHLWHPFTQVATADPPLRVVRGEGALLELDDGRRLIDGISSWWVTLHGHGEPSIAEAIARQARTLEQVGFSDFRHPAAEQLAERLAACSGLERLFFSDNGSTAVEVALKIAWQWWRNRGSPPPADRLRGRLPRRHLRGDGGRGALPVLGTVRAAAVRRGPGPLARHLVGRRRGRGTGDAGTRCSWSGCWRRPRRR